MSDREIVSYRGALMTGDTMVAQQALERKAAENGWRVRLLRPQDYQRGNPLSLLAAGREVWVQFHRDEPCDPQMALHALWSAAIPLGFAPKTRYPLVGTDDEKLYFFGRWQAVADRLMAEGRGHLVWSSVCCAAQVYVGVWKGDKPEVRLVQTHLHRLGLNPGAVDGVLGERTKACLTYLGLGSKPLPSMIEELSEALPPDAKPRELQRGHLVLPGYKLRAGGYGGVKAWPSDQGVGLEVTGPGRLVVDVT